MSEEGRFCLLADAPELIPSHSRITDPEEREHIFRRIAALSSSRYKSFPGANPVSIERCMFNKLKEQKFYAGLKTDGTRYLLLLTLWRGEPRAVMIQRSMMMYEVEIWANHSFFEKEVLLDGELCWERVGSRIRQLFLVFDAVCIRSCYRSLDYSVRLNNVHKYILGELPTGISTDANTVEQMIVDEDKLFMASPDIRMIPKGFVDVSRIGQLWAQRTSSLHQNDGIIMVADLPLSVATTDWWTMKWKPKESISVDVAYHLSGKVSASNRGKKTDLETISVHGRMMRVEIKVNQLLQYLLSNSEQGHTFILECLCNVQVDCVELFPVRERKDKTQANDVSTISATMKNIVENILVEEIASSVSSDLPIDAVQNTQPENHQDNHGRSDSGGVNSSRKSRRPPETQTSDNAVLVRPKRRTITRGKAPQAK